MHARGAPFVPPHCPRTDCRYHRSASGWRWIRHGTFTRRAAPQRIARFRCVHCGHTFSTQTFSTTYWLRRPDVLLPTAYRLLTCSGYRQLAREARCSPTTVLRHAARIGRHALLTLHALRPPGPIAEALGLAAPHPQGLTVRSDQHDDYPRALRRLSGYRVRHERTRSREARTAGNPLS